jgi:hypothetical protein
MHLMLLVTLGMGWKRVRWLLVMMILPVLVSKGRRGRRRKRVVAFIAPIVRLRIVMMINWRALRKFLPLRLVVLPMGRESAACATTAGWAVVRTTTRRTRVIFGGRNETSATLTAARLVVVHF